MSETFRFPTPLGPMKTALGPAGEVVRLGFVDRAEAPSPRRSDAPPPGRAGEASPEGADDPSSRAAGTLVRQMDEYFDGERRKFELALDPEGTGFELAVWEALLKVPWGETVSYGALAERIGRPAGSARAVGRAVSSNPIAIVIPCHRALGADGALTGYAGGIERKRALLALEGSLPLELDV